MQVKKINGILIVDTSVSALTYNNNTITSFNTDGTSYGATINTMTGLTINGNLTSNTISGVTISATTYYNLPIDVKVTGGTYSNGTTTFTNNTGGTFNVSGYYTGYTAPIDVKVTGGTYSNGIATFTNNTGGTFNVSGFNTTTPFTGGTINGSTTFTNGLTANTLNVTGLTQGSILFAGTSGLISQNNTNLFWDNTNTRLGIGTTAPSTIFQVNGNSTFGLTTGGTYNGNLYLSPVDRFPIIQFRSSGVTKTQISSDVTTGDLYIDTPGTLHLRNVLGSGDILTLVGSTGVMSLTNNVQATALNTGNLIVTGGGSFSGNLFANNIVPSYTSTTTASQTTILNSGSTQQQLFNGTTLGQIVQMPVTSTLVNGFTYTLINNSSVGITINSSGGNVIGAIPAGKTATLICVNTGVTTAAGWYMNIASSIQSLEGFPFASAASSGIATGGNQATAWGMIGTIFNPNQNMTVTLNSTMKFMYTQTATGGYLMAVYKYVVGGPHTLMFSSSVTTNPALGKLSFTVTSITDGTLVSGTDYYLTVFSSANGSTCAGIPVSSNFNTTKPYRSIIQQNFGTWNALTTAPASIADANASEMTTGIPWMRLQL